jgi:hypothetical protein
VQYEGKKISDHFLKIKFVFGNDPLVSLKYETFVVSIDSFSRKEFLIDQNLSLVKTTKDLNMKLSPFSSTKSENLDISALFSNILVYISDDGQDDDQFFTYALDNNVFDLEDLRRNNPEDYGRLYQDFIDDQGIQTAIARSRSDRITLESGGESSIMHANNVNANNLLYAAGSEYINYQT